VPNHWESYCSQFGKNVNCIGIIPDRDLEKDIETEKERSYMIHKCRIPATKILQIQNLHGSSNDTLTKLQSWSRQELASFMIQLFHDLEDGGTWGEYLLHGVPPHERELERNRLRDFVHKLESIPLVQSAGVIRVDNLSEMIPVGDPSNIDLHRVLYDTNYTRIAQGQPDNFVTGNYAPSLALYNSRSLAGVIESLTVSRKGTFSCPVAAGVVLVAQVDMKKNTSSDDTVIDALKVLILIQPPDAMRSC